MQVQPYLSFEGRCEEALEFYRQALGAKVEMMMRFKDSPDPAACVGGAGAENKVLHSSFTIGDTQVMASDGRCSGKASFEGIALSIAAPDVAKARKIFASLSEGGQVQMPLSESFFAQSFGMVADRFGVSWMVIAGPKQPS